MGPPKDEKVDKHCRYCASCDCADSIYVVAGGGSDE